MSSLEKNSKPYSKAIVRLLKSTVENNSNVWEDVINYQNEIQEYISQIGLELIVKKDEGFAFVKQLEDSEGNSPFLRLFGHFQICQFFDQQHR